MYNFYCTFALANRKTMVCRESAFSLFCKKVNLDIHECNSWNKEFVNSHFVFMS